MDDSKLSLNSKENVDLKLDGTPCKMMQSETETGYSISYVADSSANFKTDDKLSVPTLSSRIETNEFSSLQNPSSGAKTVDIFFLGHLMHSIGEGKYSPSMPACISFEIDENCVGSCPNRNQTNLGSEKTRSKFSISGEMPSDYVIKVDSLLQKRKVSIRNEITESSSSEMHSYIDTGNGLPDLAALSFGKKGNDGLLACLICSSIEDCLGDGEDLDCCWEEEKFICSNEKLKINYDSNSSKKQIKLSESGETPLLSTVEETFSRMSLCFKQKDGSTAPKMTTRDEKTDQFSSTENSSEHLTLNEMSCIDQTTNASREPSTVSDENDNCSVCSSFGDYYEDDADLHRFCEADNSKFLISANLEAEPFQNENLNMDAERNDSGPRFVTSDKNYGAVVSKIVSKEVESPDNSFVLPATPIANTSLLNESELLMQVKQFFSENPVNHSQNTSVRGRLYNTNSSRYFHDEFAKQILTENENGVIMIREELEEDTATEVESSEVLTFMKSSYNEYSY